MAGLCFKIAELERETKALKIIGNRFLDSQSLWTLEQFSSELRSIGGTRGESARNIKLQCLHTMPSNQYEIGSRRGGQKIHAVISGTWGLRPLGNRPAPGRKVEFCGNSSTRIELYASDDSETRLAMWRMEELFQDEWAKATAGNSSEVLFWRALQQKRLQSLFSWYQSELKNSVSSPWMTLKEAKPDGELFVPN